MNTSSTNALSVVENLSKVRAMIRRHKLNDTIFATIGLLTLMFGLIMLFVLFADLVMDGYPKLNWAFLSEFQSRRAENAGILAAWVDSLLVMLVTFCYAVPVGVAAGLYLEEYAKKNWFTDLIEINVANLAAIPSIIYGILGLAVFVPRANSPSRGGATAHHRGGGGLRVQLGAVRRQVRQDVDQILPGQHLRPRRSRRWPRRIPELLHGPSRVRFGRRPLPKAFPGYEKRGRHALEQVSGNDLRALPFDASGRW